MLNAIAPTALFGPTGGWKRRCVLIFAMAIVSASFVTAGSKPLFKHTKQQEIAVTARQIPSFDKVKSNVTRFGNLLWRGGVELSSPSKHFGGWSGLRLGAKGRALLAVSDAGTWLRGEISYADGHIVGIKNAKLGPLQALSGKKLRRGRDRDAEAVALLNGTIHNGLALIAFEQNDRVGLFPITKSGVGKPKRYLKLPDAIRKNRSRNGVEAVAALRGRKHNGSILTFFESKLSDDNYHRGWLLRRGKPKKIWLKDKGGFSITDIAALADGGAVVLERRFRWAEGVKLRVRYLPAKTIRPGAKLDGEVLLEADMNQQIDNMEGLAVHRTKKGGTVLTLISDDNFNSLFQRTVLLQFAWDRKPSRAALSKNQPH